MRPIVVRAFASIAMVFLVSTISGCGDGPSLVPARGIVTLDGQPLEGATVSFVPVPGNPVSTAGTDATGPQGNFTMTHNGRAGLAPGKYKVLVSKTEEIAPKGKEVSPIFAKASFEKRLMGLTKETIPPQKLEKEIEVPEAGVTDLALDFKSASSKGKK